MVLLHAGVADRRSWTETMTRLESEYRLVAYDRRQFGDTEYLPENFSHTDDLDAVVSHVDAGQVALIGNSQGGRIAIDYALANPEQVSALILVGTAISGAPIVDDHSINPAVLAMDAASEEAFEQGDLTETNRLEAHLWLDGPLATEGRVSGKQRALFLDMNGRALAAASPGDEIEPPSAYERLSELTMPTLTIVGDQDMSLMLDRAEQVVERVDGAQLEVMEGTAHIPQLEQPTKFAAIVGSFLGGL